MALGVKYKGKFSFVVLNIESFLNAEYSNKDLESKVSNQIIEDDNFSPQEYIHSIAISKTCKFIALGSKGKIYIYSRTTNESNELESVFRYYSHNKSTELSNLEVFNVNQVRYSPTFESLLVSAGGDGSLRFYNSYKRKISSKMIYMKNKQDEINGFLDVGWNPEGTWMYYTKGYDSKFGDLKNDEREIKIQNKMYFVSWEEVFQKCISKEFLI